MLLWKLMMAERTRKVLAAQMRAGHFRRRFIHARSVRARAERHEHDKNRQKPYGQAFEDVCQ